MKSIRRLTSTKRSGATQLPGRLLSLVALTTLVIPALTPLGGCKGKVGVTVVRDRQRPSAEQPKETLLEIELDATTRNVAAKLRQRFGVPLDLRLRTRIAQIIRAGITEFGQDRMRSELEQKLKPILAQRVTVAIDVGRKALARIKAQLEKAPSNLQRISLDIYNRRVMTQRRKLLRGVESRLRNIVLVQFAIITNELIPKLVANVQQTLATAINEPPATLKFVGPAIHLMVQKQLEQLRDTIELSLASQLLGGVATRVNEGLPLAEVESGTSLKEIVDEKLQKFTARNEFWAKQLLKRLQQRMKGIVATVLGTTMVALRAKRATLKKTPGFLQENAVRLFNAEVAKHKARVLAKLRQHAKRLVNQQIRIELGSISRRYAGKVLSTIRGRASGGISKSLLRSFEKPLQGLVIDRLVSMHSEAIENAQEQLVKRFAAKIDSNLRDANPKDGGQSLAEFINKNLKRIGLAPGALQRILARHVRPLLDKAIGAGLGLARKAIDRAAAMLGKVGGFLKNVVIGFINTVVKEQSGKLLAQAAKKLDYFLGVQFDRLMDKGEATILARAKNLISLLLPGFGEVATKLNTLTGPLKQIIKEKVAELKDAIKQSAKKLIVDSFQKRLAKMFPPRKKAKGPTLSQWLDKKLVKLGLDLPSLRKKVEAKVRPFIDRTFDRVFGLARKAIASAKRVLGKVPGPLYNLAIEVYNTVAVKQAGKLVDSIDGRLRGFVKKNLEYVFRQGVEAAIRFAESKVRGLGLAWQVSRPLVAQLKVAIGKKFDELKVEATKALSHLLLRPLRLQVNKTFVKLKPKPGSLTLDKWLRKELKGRGLDIKSLRQKLVSKVKPFLDRVFGTAFKLARVVIDRARGALKKAPAFLQRIAVSVYNDLVVKNSRKLLKSTKERVTKFIDNNLSALLNKAVRVATDFISGKIKNAGLARDVLQPLMLQVGAVVRRLLGDVQREARAAILKLVFDPVEAQVKRTFRKENAKKGPTLKQWFSKKFGKLGLNPAGLRKKLEAKVGPFLNRFFDRAFGLAQKAVGFAKKLIDKAPAFLRKIAVELYNSVVVKQARKLASALRKKVGDLVGANLGRLVETTRRKLMNLGRDLIAKHAAALGVGRDILLRLQKQAMGFVASKIRQAHRETKKAITNLLVEPLAKRINKTFRKMSQPKGALTLKAWVSKQIKKVGIDFAALRRKLESKIRGPLEKAYDAAFSVVDKVLGLARKGLKRLPGFLARPAVALYNSQVKDRVKGLLSKLARKAQGFIGKHLDGAVKGNLRKLAEKLLDLIKRKVGGEGAMADVVKSLLPKITAVLEQKTDELKRETRKALANLLIKPLRERAEKALHMPMPPGGGPTIAQKVGGMIQKLLRQGDKIARQVTRKVKGAYNKVVRLAGKAFRKLKRGVKKLAKKAYRLAKKVCKKMPSFARAGCILLAKKGKEKAMSLLDEKLTKLLLELLDRGKSKLEGLIERAMDGVVRKHAQKLVGKASDWLASKLEGIKVDPKILGMAKKQVKTVVDQGIDTVKKTVKHLVVDTLVKPLKRELCRKAKLDDCN